MSALAKGQKPRRFDVLNLHNRDLSLSFFPLTLPLLLIQATPTAGLSDSEQEPPLTLSSLPVELLLSIFLHLPSSSLLSLSLSCHYLRSVAQPSLFHSPLIQSLFKLDQFLEALSDKNGLNREVRELTVVGRVFKSKGFGLRVMRILRLIERVKRLEIVGVDDLRPKHLVSSSSPSSGSFHSLPYSPRFSSPRDLPL